MAEIEYSLLVRQGVQHNIATFEELVQQVESWKNRRNSLGTVVHWYFTTADARVKLARLYPVIEESARLKILLRQSWLDKPVTAQTHSICHEESGNDRLEASRKNLTVS